MYFLLTLPFSEARAIINIPTDKLFTGQRLDGTGLYFYNARYYDPTIGRFISADTVIQSSFVPQTRNRYTYSLNNPLKYIDPSGHYVSISGYNVQAIDYLRGFSGMTSEYVQLVYNVTSSTAYQAYNTIRYVDNYYTNIIEQDHGIIVNIYDGPCKGNTMAETTNRGSEISIKLNNDHDLTFDQRVANVAHEIGGHVMGKVYDTKNGIENSKFEENNGDIYAYSICKGAGLSYTSPFVAPENVTPATLQHKYEKYWGKDSDYYKLPDYPIYNGWIEYRDEFMQKLSEHITYLYSLYK